MDVGRGLVSRVTCPRRLPAVAPGPFGTQDPTQAGREWIAGRRRRPFHKSPLVADSDKPLQWPGGRDAIRPLLARRRTGFRQFSGSLPPRQSKDGVLSMARKSKKKPTLRATGGGRGGHGCGCPAPVKRALTTRWGARLAFVAAVVLFVSGVVTVQWTDSRPHLSLNRQRAKQVKQAIVEEAYKLGIEKADRRDAPRQSGQLLGGAAERFAVPRSASRVARRRAFRDEMARQAIPAAAGPQVRRVCLDTPACRHFAALAAVRRSSLAALASLATAAASVETGADAGSAGQPPS